MKLGQIMWSCVVYKGMWGYAELFGVRPIGMGSEKYGVTLSYGVWWGMGRWRFGGMWSHLELC